MRKVLVLGLLTLWVWMIGCWAIIIWAVFTPRGRWMGGQDRVAGGRGRRWRFWSGGMLAGC